MFSKLIKHEFKETWRLMLILNAVIVFLTLIGHITLRSSILENDDFVIIGILFTFLYAFSIIAIVLVTFLYLIIRYYQTMFGKRGYLTYTLPTTPFMVFNSKLFVGAFWTFVNLLVTVLSFLVLFRSLSAIDPTDSVGFWEFFAETLGCSVPEILAYMITFTILFCFSGLMIAYFCFAIGQLFAKHKIAGTILTYIIIYLFNQVLSTIYMFFLSFKTIFVSANDMLAPDLFLSLMQMSILSSIVEFIIFYIVNAYIITKKVDFD